jgi:hypothetical protein
MAEREKSIFSIAHWSTRADYNTKYQKENKTKVKYKDFFKYEGHL